MGRAAVYDLTRAGQKVRLLESDAKAARRVADRYGSGRASVEIVDARRPGSVGGYLEDVAVLINCAPYSLNLPVMEEALGASCHYLDLGGLFHTTRKQWRRDKTFRDAGLLAIIGMGSAPGIVNVLARAAADTLRRVHSIRVYNGGADFTRYKAPIAFAFSPSTLLDELVLPAIVYEGRRFRPKPALSGRERFPFELGPQEVHLSLHSEVATLPVSFRAKGIRDCCFKTAWDDALLERMKLLVDLGLADTRPGPRGVAPREVLLDCLGRLPSPPEFIDDRDCLSVIVEGKDTRGEVSLRYDLTAKPQRHPPLSAVARDTGFPASIVARMVLSGLIRARGVHPPETSVPVRPFLESLARRGMRPRLTVSRPT